MSRFASLLSLFALLVPVAQAEPFRVHDENPLLAGFGVPPALPSEVESAGAWSASFDLAWSSSAVIQRSGARQLIVDAESQSWRLSVARSFGDRFALQLRAPYRRTQGGSLDGFIDDWHSFFSLPAGARRQLPQDDLQVSLEDESGVALQIGVERSGLGDVALDVGYALHASPLAAAALWLTVEAPTGDAQELTSNEAVDVSLALSGQRTLGAHWLVYGQAAISYLGEGEWLAEQQKLSAWSVVAGVTWRRGALDLTAQFDAHTALFEDLGLDYLGEAVALTLGGAVRFASAWRLELAVTEDIMVESTTDVAFFFGLRYAPDAH